MSELSEEEIIDNIKFVLRDLTADRYNVNFVNAIKGLLDLYQKEKEKNKKLEDADLTTVYINGFYDGEKKWKDKIKEIVDLYDNTLQCTRKYNDELANILCDLQELLEERN